MKNLNRKNECSPLEIHCYGIGSTDGYIPRSMQWMQDDCVIEGIDGDRVAEFVPKNWKWRIKINYNNELMPNEFDSKYDAVEWAKHNLAIVRNFVTMQFFKSKIVG